MRSLSYVAYRLPADIIQQAIRSSPRPDDGESRPRTLFVTETAPYRCSTPLGSDEGIAAARVPFTSSMQTPRTDWHPIMGPAGRGKAPTSSNPQKQPNSPTSRRIVSLRPRFSHDQDPLQTM